MRAEAAQICETQSIISWAQKHHRKLFENPLETPKNDSLA
jgi:hypothetical protein